MRAYLEHADILEQQGDPLVQYILQVFVNLSIFLERIWHKKVITEDDQSC